ncbi:MAG: carbon starvation protein A [Gemmatimonadota bacterium]|nr:MAG: carbon starvation protein A [Gemmatimonadota bacterium]
MNSLILALSAFVLFTLGYRFYGRKIEKLWEVNPSRKTPAVEQYDGIDYVPARHWTVLFGHHFASIAGAGPIIGPVIAAMVWGWLPAALWLIVGSIFLGGVHDLSAFMVSLRHRGKSVADVAQSVMGFRAKMIFAMFVWLALVLVIAVFAAVAARTLSTTPEVVIPTFGVVGVAVLVGLLMYRWNVTQVLATIIGMTLLFGLILLGYFVPISLGPNAAIIWTVILLLYAFVASIMPVNILLQPRDYLVSVVLFFGLIFGYAGVVITHPPMHAPAFITFHGDQGYLWPMMCVIIACGAISGFHSLVAGGTTSKQLANERDAKKVGYGAMLLEGVLSVLALIAVAGGLYWSENEGVPGLMYPRLMEGGNWIVTFGTGYGQLVKPFLGVLGMFVGIMMLKTFVMTTLDTATRIARYLAEELFGEGLKIKPLRNKYVSTSVIFVIALVLALGSWQAIWPIFGASNQLIAALVLIVISTYLLSRGKHAAYTLIPAIFMLITTMAALVYKSLDFIRGGKALLAVVGLLLFVLALFICYEAARTYGRLKKRQTGESPV